jgi:hypothetical protein
MLCLFFKRIRPIVPLIGSGLGNAFIVLIKAVFGTAVKAFCLSLNAVVTLIFILSPPF